MSENAQLLASDGATDDYFGYSVGISGNQIIVGAYGNDDNGNKSGSVYLFQKVGPTTWYSYQSGNWASFNNWTLDGGLFPLYDNPRGTTPDIIDNVVITTGKTITITRNNIITNGIEIIGTLDITGTNDHDFTVIRGYGTLRMSGSNGIDNFSFWYGHFFCRCFRRYNRDLWYRDYAKSKQDI